MLWVWRLLLALGRSRLSRGRVEDKCGRQRCGVLTVSGPVCLDTGVLSVGTCVDIAGCFGHTVLMSTIGAIQLDLIYSLTVGDVW
jgi:hypothetical protein